jgi:hypothetical protein
VHNMRQPLHERSISSVTFTLIASQQIAALQIILVPVPFPSDWAGWLECSEGLCVRIHEDAR